jgi:hypothetical protein
MKVLVFVLASLMALPGCDSPGGPDDEGDLAYDRLLQGLRESSLSAQPAGQLSQPFFSIPVRLIAINPDQVQVLEYPDERSARTDAARVSPDGSTVGNSHVDWVAPPHFYRTGRLLVLYVGNRTDIKTALERLLGPQFAGR